MEGGPEIKVVDKVVDRFVLVQLGASTFKLDTQSGTSWILKVGEDGSKQEWVHISDCRPSQEYLGQRA